MGFLEGFCCCGWCYGTVKGMVVKFLIFSDRFIMIGSFGGSLLILASLLKKLSGLLDRYSALQETN